MLLGLTLVFFGALSAGIIWAFFGINWNRLRMFRADEDRRSVAMDGDEFLAYLEKIFADEDKRRG